MFDSTSRKNDFPLLLHQKNSKKDMKGTSKSGERCGITSKMQFMLIAVCTVIV